MKVLVQRAKDASVVINDLVHGQIDVGFVLLVGITHTDTIQDCEYLAKKVANLRVFEDETGKMNKSIIDINGKVLSISQFTLYASTRKGNRPSFVDAAKPDYAKELYECFNKLLLAQYNINVETGVFGADMKVDFINDGPVTIMLESK